MYEECNVDLCRGMTEAMRGNILLLAQNVNGCRVLQAAIEYSDHDHLVTMLESELKNQIPACAIKQRYSCASKVPALYAVR